MHLQRGKIVERYGAGKVGSRGELETSLPAREQARIGSSVSRIVRRDIALLDKSYARLATFCLLCCVKGGVSSDAP